MYFNHLFVVRYQKLAFCGKRVAKMENSLGEHA